MRFFCRFKGEEAEYIKSLFAAVGVGRTGGPSVRQFTRTAISKEIKHLAELYKKHEQKQQEPEAEAVASEEEV
jgi:hypothetical protein